MITIKLSCGQCSKETEVIIAEEKHPLKNLSAHELIKQVAKKANWIVQDNYPYFDTYCSNKCAL